MCGSNNALRGNTEKMSALSLASKSSLRLAIAVLLLTGILFPQAKKNPKKTSEPGQPATPASSTQKSGQQSTANDAEQEEQKGPWHGLTWRSIGPFRGGRVLAVSGVVGDPHTYYFGGVGGGVWKTRDGGLTWRPMTDKVKDMSPSVGAIAVAPSDSNVIYAGTGEACIRGNIISGNGVYNSTDGGKTWAFSGLRDTLA